MPYSDVSEDHGCGGHCSLFPSNFFEVDDIPD